MLIKKETTEHWKNICLGRDRVICYGSLFEIWKYCRLHLDRFFILKLQLPQALSACLTCVRFLLSTEFADVTIGAALSRAVSKSWDRGSSQREANLRQAYHRRVDTKHRQLTSVPRHGQKVRAQEVILKSESHQDPKTPETWTVWINISRLEDGDIHEKLTLPGRRKLSLLATR